MAKSSTTSSSKRAAEEEAPVSHEPVKEVKPNLRRFRLKHGKHSQHGQIYQQGDIVESLVDLADKHGRKFEELV